MWRMALRLRRSSSFAPLSCRRSSSEKYGLSHANESSLLTSRHFTIPSFFLLLWVESWFPMTCIVSFIALPSPFLSVGDCSSLVQVLKSNEIPVANWCSPNSVIWCKDCPLTTTGVKVGGGVLFCSAPVCPRDMTPSPPLLPSSVQTTFWLCFRTCYQKERVISLSFIIGFPCMRACGVTHSITTEPSRLSRSGLTLVSSIGVFGAVPLVSK